MNTPKLILAECRNWFEDVHNFTYFILPHQRYAAVALVFVSVVILKRVGIHILPAVHDRAIRRAVPSLALVAALTEHVAPPIVDPENKVIARQAVHVQNVVEPIAVG